MRKIFNIHIFMLGLIMISCSEHNKTPSEKNYPVENPEVMASITLTVSESKKLIAEGLASYPAVKEKMKNGRIIITRGTTNTYLAEKLAKLNADHGAFVTGKIEPESKKKEIKPTINRIPEIYLVNGKHSKIPLEEALQELQEDDIIFKGANIMNYENKSAAVCIGAPDGGTTAKIMPYIGRGKARLIIPIGLEKDASSDLLSPIKLLKEEKENINFLPKLFCLEGEIFTEIEALKQFGDINAFVFAKGGINGAEGAVSIAISGTAEEVKKVLDKVYEIQGEPPFIK